MADIIIGEKVLNSLNEQGTIVSFNDEIINVDFKWKVAKFSKDAFEKGYLRYQNIELQEKVNVIKETVNITSNKEENKEDKKHEKIEIKHEEKVQYVIRLEPKPINLNKVRKNDKSIIEEVFKICDEDAKELYKSFKPKMTYPKYTSYARSKYFIGYVCNYLDTYVLRVFSRNDIYKNRVKTGVSIMESDTTEILRALCVNGKTYTFTKNFTISKGYIINSQEFNKWHLSELDKYLVVNEIVRNCDCKYLNEYVNLDNINCSHFINLFFLSLYNNKVEILFKNKLFTEASRIDNLTNYLDQFTSKQIDFASKHNIINTLPVIKQYSTYDVDTLQKMEMVMKKSRYGRSVYDLLEIIFSRLNFDTSDIYKRLLSFVRNVDIFDSTIYEDYIYLVSRVNRVTVKDFFDRDYINRHDILVRENKAYASGETKLEYLTIAKELSWIDREDNGYYIIIPKTVDDFKKEGSTQHICVYSLAYYRKVVNKQSIIVFLRKEKDTPYVTIEYDYETFEVIQARMKYNASVKGELKEYIIDLGRKLFVERCSNN